MSSKLSVFLKGVSGVQSNYKKQFTNDDLQVVCEDSTETSFKELFARQERFAPSDQSVTLLSRFTNLLPNHKSTLARRKYQRQLNQFLVMRALTVAFHLHLFDGFLEQITHL